MERNNESPISVKKQTEKFLKGIENEIENYRNATSFQKNECLSSNQKPEKEDSFSDEKYIKSQRVLTTTQMNDIFGEDENYWVYIYSHNASLSATEEELLILKKTVRVSNCRIRALESVRKEMTEEQQFYRWKVIKSTIYQPDRMKFFSSDEDLIDYLDKVLESYEEVGFCDVYDTDIESIIKQAIKVGNEVIDITGTGIREIVKLE